MFGLKKKQTGLDVVHSAIGELDPKGDSEEVSMYIVSVAKDKQFTSATELFKAARSEFVCDNPSHTLSLELEGE